MNKATPLFLSFLFLGASSSLLYAEEGLTPVVERAMKMVDKNNDGKLTLEEYKPLDIQARHHGEQHFTRADANKDGFLDPAELATELARQQTWFVILSEGIGPCFKRTDTDGNSKIDAAEYRKLSRMGGHAGHHHHGADTNQDGFLDLEEFTVHANEKLESAANPRKKKAGE